MTIFIVALFESDKAHVPCPSVKSATASNPPPQWGDKLAMDKERILPCS